MIGVTCRITANGNRLSSSHLDAVNRMARPTPPTVATASAMNVTWSVIRSEGQSVPQSAIRLCSTSSGPGRM